MDRFIKIPDKIMASTDIKAGPKIILVLILRYKNIKNQSYPSLRTLSKLTGYNKNTLIAYIKVLKDKNILKVYRGNSHKSNLYVLNPPDLWEISGTI